jgi:hypothetical protein
MLVKHKTYPIGTRVRVARGQLAGVAGVVANLIDGHHNCVLTVAGWQEGYLVVNSELLILDAEEERESTARDLRDFVLDRLEHLSSTENERGRRRRFYEEALETAREFWK